MLATASKRRIGAVDPRIEAYAKLLVERSLDVQRGWQVWINSSALGRPLVEEVVRLIARRGAYPLVRLGGAAMEDVPFETLWALEAPEDDRHTSPQQEEQDLDGDQHAGQAPADVARELGEESVAHPEMGDCQQRVSLGIGPAIHPDASSVHLRCLTLSRRSPDLAADANAGAGPKLLYL